MSYCRWSSNNWDCDLYCYADCSGGYTTHVASNRVVGTVPPMPEWKKDMSDADCAAYFAAHRAQMDWLNTAKHKHIGLPYDGQSFNDDTLAEFLDRVVWLRDMGYHVPEYVIQDIREEIAPRSEAQDREAK